MKTTQRHTKPITIMIHDKKGIWFYKNEVKSENQVLALPNNEEGWAIIEKAVNNHEKLVALANAVMKFSHGDDLVDLHIMAQQALQSLESES